MQLNFTSLQPGGPSSVVILDNLSISTPDSSKFFQPLCIFIYRFHMRAIFPANLHILVIVVMILSEVQTKTHSIKCIDKILILTEAIFHLFFAL